ncbi:MAG: sortase [Actinomycetaceae bacterium]|nr:sortase [Arcanobacterium sp.]MDD7687379.1 sortase [Actinomycetaceae bacterium]MDY5273530.1 sortase [Arcanobacterium sp.]
MAAGGHSHDVAARAALAVLETQTVLAVSGRSRVGSERPARRRRIGLLLSVAGIIPLLAAGWFFGARVWSEYQAQQVIPEILAAVRKQMPVQRVEVLSADAMMALELEKQPGQAASAGVEAGQAAGSGAGSGSSANSGADGGRRSRAALDPSNQWRGSWLAEGNPVATTPAVTADGHMNSVPVDRRDYVGILEIPSLGLELPVMLGVDREPVPSAPNAWYGSVYADSLVIGAVNYKSQFGRIAELPDGAHIMFTDMLGQRFHYRVAGIGDVPSDDGAALRAKPEPWDLTLFTPSFSGIQRVLVRAVAL